jgi:hypothetical protein
MMFVRGLMTVDDMNSHILVSRVSAPKRLIEVKRMPHMINNDVETSSANVQYCFSYYNRRRQSTGYIVAVSYSCHPRDRNARETIVYFIVRADIN